MTKLPDRRNPGDRIPLMPRGELPEGAPIKLPEQRDPTGRDRLPTQPRGDQQAVAFTRLPEHRHSDEEVQTMRRRQALQVRPPVAHIRNQMAATPVVVAGYLMALAGGVAWLATKEEWEYARLVHGLGVGGGVAAVVIAALIALKKPRSRHHAAFIAMVGLLVIVFGVLQLIPHLNAT